MGEQEEGKTGWSQASNAGTIYLSFLLGHFLEGKFSVNRLRSGLSPSGSFPEL